MSVAKISNKPTQCYYEYQFYNKKSPAYYAGLLKVIVKTILRLSVLHHFWCCIADLVACLICKLFKVLNE